MRILFQGDSITDAGRDRADIHNLGYGYPKFAAEIITANHPSTTFEFINLGISGNKAEDLRERWQVDCIDHQPDIISILIGVNDTWHHAESRNWMSHEYFEVCYRDILTSIKQKTSAKIIILEQFLLAVPDKDFFRIDLDPKIQITRKLAREFADIFIPFDGLFAAASISAPPTHWANDGVHPSEAGARFMAKKYARAISKLM